MDAGEWLTADELELIDVKPAVMEAFNEQLQRDLAGTSWAAAPESWYTDAGRVTNDWPYSTLHYWRRTRAMVHAEYRTERRCAESSSEVVARSAA